MIIKSSVVLLVYLANFGCSLPTKPYHKLNLHRRDANLPVPFYYPASHTKSPNTKNSFEENPAPDLDLAYAALCRNFGIRHSDVVLDRNFTDSSNVKHLFFTRTVSGILVANQNCAVHIANHIVTYLTSSFTITAAIVKRDLATIDTTVAVSLAEAVASAEANFSCVYAEGTNATLGFILTPEETLSYAHTFQIRDIINSIWLQVSVDAATGTEL